MKTSELLNRRCVGLNNGEEGTIIKVNKNTCVINWDCENVKTSSELISNIGLLPPPKTKGAER